MITIRHLKKEYPSAIPLMDVNAEINKGDVISVIGPSGTGKSTLIRCINMLETPTAGEIIVDGKNLTDGSCDINKVRQKMAAELIKERKSANGKLYETDRRKEGQKGEGQNPKGEACRILL